jgi:hypothetical protein
MIRQYFPREVPEFDWEQYNQFVKNWYPYQPPAPEAARPKSTATTRKKRYRHRRNYGRGNWQRRW